MSNPPPLSNGRYMLSGTLGQGGMATVYGGFDTMLEVERAVKVLSPALCSSEKLRRRFLAEARAMAKLRHPNIVTVFDVGVDGQTPYIVMEKVDGGSVMGLVERDGAQPPEVASHIVLAALAGLQASHERGVIHRDMKLHNLLISTSGEVKITDFGIAQLSGEQSYTKTGAIMGTLAYMPPEQRHSAKGLGPTADVFACGASLYALLSGREPFDVYNESLHDKLFAGIPSALRRVIVRSCQYEAADRYVSAESMANDLREAMTQLGISIDPNLKVPIDEDQVSLFEPVTRPPMQPSSAPPRRDSTTINPKDTWFTTHGERAQNQPFATEPEGSTRSGASKTLLMSLAALMVLVGMAVVVMKVNVGSNDPIAPSLVDQTIEGDSNAAGAPNAGSPRQPMAPEPAVPVPKPPPTAEPSGTVDAVVEVVEGPIGSVASKADRAPDPIPTVVETPSERVPKTRAIPDAPEAKSASESPPARAPTQLVLRAIPPISVVYMDGRRLDLVNSTVTTDATPGIRELKFSTKDGLYGSARVDVPAGGSLRACFRFVDAELKKC